MINIINVFEIMTNNYKYTNMFGSVKQLGLTIKPVLNDTL